MPWISLGTGVWSAFLQSRTWDEVHWIGWMLAAAWGSAAILGLVESRLPTDHPSRIGSGVRLLLGLVSQNASQEALFFVLPFWIRSTTFLSENGPFTVLLVCLGAATLYDPLYLGAILPHRSRRTLFKALLLFAGLDFLLAALTSRSTIECTAIAGAWSGAVAGLGFSRWKARGLLWGSLAGLALAWTGRNAIAPVPLYLNHPVLCSGIEDLAPRDTLASVPARSEAWYWTPIFAPPGRTDSVRHEWSRDGEPCASVLLPLQGGRKDGFRTWSSSRLVASRPGDGSIEVRLQDGQLLGRTSFEIEPAP